MKNLFIYGLLAVASATFGYALYTKGIPYFTKSDSSSQKITNSGNSIQGRLRPVFSLPDLKGESHSIDDWNGKVVLINFWATWCPPCRREIPELNATHQRYVDKGFEVLGLAFDETDLVARFVDDMDLRYTQLIADLSDSNLMRQYGNISGALPYSVLIDRNGIIQFTHAGVLQAEELERELQKYL